MARCRCSGDVCICQLRAGTNVRVDGVGSVQSPWIISSLPSSEGTVLVNDTPSVNLESAGVGSQAVPFILTAHAQIAPLLTFVDSLDVDFQVSGAGVEGDPLIVTAEVPGLDLTGGNPGDVLTQQPDGSWAPGPPNVVDPGAISVGFGLTGNGSVAAPLRVDVCTYGDLKAMCVP